MKLFYFPLEPYIERYTWFMSCPNGWFEDHARNLGSELVRIEGRPATSAAIRKGAVLDTIGRSLWALDQVSAFLDLIDRGEVSDGDMLYVEDFWHPGIESIFYARQFGGPKITIGTFFYAQSVDESDFMHEAKQWCRGIEEGYSKGYDAIFLTSPILKQLMVDAGMGRDGGGNVHVTGLAFNSPILRKQIKGLGVTECADRKGVLFSSRFDAEKNPHFFMDLAEAMHTETTFSLVLPKPIHQCSNDPTAILRLSHLVKLGIISVIDTSQVEGGLGKKAYYQALSNTKVQFNCAEQDWTSFTLLEAAALGALPLYPKWKDFPRELNNTESFLYTKGSLWEAIEKLRALLSPDAATHDTMLASLVSQYDQSIPKSLSILAQLTTP